MTTYTPPPPPPPPPPGTPSVSSTQNHSQRSSRTHDPSPHSASGSPSSSTGPSDTPNSKGEVNRSIALATTFVGLAIVVAVLITLYYRRRYRPRHNGQSHFFSLRDDDGDSGRSQPIPTVVMVDQDLNAERRSTFGLFNPLRLPGSLASVLRRNIEQPVAQRRDMLADEDAYDDGQWFYLRRVRDAERSSWSFKSFVSNLPRSREPSATDLSVVTHRREKSDPFSDEKAVQETMSLEREPLTHSDRDSMPIHPTYRDPFMDPIQRAYEGREWADGTSTSIRLSAKLPAHYDSVSPNFVTTLSPLPEQVSQSSLPCNDSPGSFIELEDTLSGNTVPTSGTTLISPAATSLINANPGPTTQISRTDSWWRRFSRNSFLDRSLSTTSRKSPSMDLKEHPALLAPIEEQANPLALKSVMRRSVEVVNNPVKSRSASNFYEVAHAKSLSSLRTADTEAIEKIEIGRAHV